MFGGCRTWCYLALGAGVLTLAGCAAPHRRAGALRAAARGANLVICVIDAARADHVGCYGYPRDTTPNTDRLARESTIFTQHFVQFTRTKESTASLFTSQYPDTHLAYLDRPLDPAAFTMAKGLAEAGLVTALFSSNPNASPALGLGRDFQRTCYDPDIRQVLAGSETRWSPEPLLRLFKQWLSETSDKRFFAYLHLMPPHQPYAPPEAITALFKGQTPPGYRPDKYHPEKYDWPIPIEPHDKILPLPEWINRYDANLRYADWAVGELARILEEAQVFENTLFIVTSDHGEAFGEHGFVWHGEPIHDEVSHVPLLIRFPHAARTGRTDALTESIDLLPTAFDLFRIPYPEDAVQGRSLLPLMAGSAREVRPFAFTRAARHGHKYMVRDTGYALLLWGNGRWRTLYDLQADPDQEHDVAARQPAEMSKLLRAFEEYARKQRVPPLNFLDPNVPPPRLPPVLPTSPTPEMKKALESLGYRD